MLNELELVKQKCIDEYCQNVHEYSRTNTHNTRGVFHNMSDFFIKTGVTTDLESKEMNQGT